MSLAPVVGLVLGSVAAGVGLGLRALGGPVLLAAVGTVATTAILTRGLHLDGLADTADGLGSYADRETSLAIMRKPDIGPFGVVALVVTLLAQASALSAVPSPVVAVAVAMATGRLAAVWACRRGVPAARPDGLGALVAGTVGAPTLALNTVAVALLAVVAVPGRPWQGPAAVAAALAIALLVTYHAVRRFGGITGDVLGALVEIGTTVALFGLAVTD